MPIEIRNSDGTYEIVKRCDMPIVIDTIRFKETLDVLGTILSIPVSPLPRACYTIRDLMLAGF